MRFRILPQLLLAAAPLAPAYLSPAMWDVRLQANGKIDAPAAWKQIEQNDSSQGISRVYSNPDSTRGQRADVGPELKFSNRNLELLSTRDGRLEAVVSSIRTSEHSKHTDDTGDDEGTEEVRVVSYATDHTLKSHTQCWGRECMTVTPLLCQGLLTASKSKSFGELEVKRIACTDLIRNLETAMKIPEVADETKREFTANSTKINSSHVRDWRARIRLAIGTNKNDNYIPADLTTLGTHASWMSEAISICSYYSEAKALPAATSTSTHAPSAQSGTKREAKP